MPKTCASHIGHAGGPGREVSGVKNRGRQYQTRKMLEREACMSSEASAADY